ncbi:hypothetical protein [Lentzea sp. NEAU-D7]|nr:hypothetical protein [Lentzea sp. NEAU-D7]MCX2951507.1 hypothetical protein [Lentzea sp. NEAU-D7]
MRRGVPTSSGIVITTAPRLSGPGATVHDALRSECVSAGGRGDLRFT